MTRVKICGITRWEDARLACELGASALGFNFYEKSPRAIAPAAAWEIIRRLPPFVAPVGVFVNWDSVAVLALARSLRLAAVQLHGDEHAPTVNACAKQIPVIKALRVGADFNLSKLDSFESACAFLFDAAPSGRDSGHFGGTGLRTDWRAAREASKSHRILLAGGLTPENVAEAIRSVGPYAVDVASGVESAPGIKDPAKLREFFSAILST
ncbi:MAG TPA: phosphoribosylanthranilate isomerase [Candidatus Acidoferrum sp.]|nr:phosphoribosylanthranilate isomerase [Candidatus Acidoferrum sp.]